MAAETDHDVVHVAVTLSDGSVARLAFNRNGRSPTLPHGGQWISLGRWHREATDENIFAEVSKAYSGIMWDQNLQVEVPGPIATGYKVITDADFPHTGDYRGAWALEGNAIVHDMAKARTIHLDVLRAERGKELQKLDTDWMRATGQKDPTEADAVEAKRQALRDMPVTLAPEIDAATTIEDLKVIRLPE